MSRVYVSFVAVILGVLSTSSGWAQQAVYIVRHAERLDGSHDSPLSPAGEARAGRLAHMLSASNIKTIYATEFRRTTQTAAPLAKSLNLDTTIIASSDTDTLLKDILSHDDDEAVLVVGHNNTIPDILKALGHTEEVPLGGDVYDLLFILVPRAQEKPTLVQIKF